MPSQDEYIEKELDRLRDVVATMGSNIAKLSTEIAAMRERQTFLAVGMTVLQVIGGAIAVAIATYLRP